MLTCECQVEKMTQQFKGLAGALSAPTGHASTEVPVSTFARDDSTKPLSPRTRFEVFKRDSFTCKYCGRQSPQVVLEVDHIVPRCDGGSNDPINLTTACWDCNRGKGGVSLEQVVTGEDPHDRAVMLLERERQLREYNHVLAESRERCEREAEELIRFWCDASGYGGVYPSERHWLIYELDRVPAERIRQAMEVALARRKTEDFRYVSAVLGNWKKEGKA